MLRGSSLVEIARAAREQFVPTVEILRAAGAYVLGHHEQSRAPVLDAEPAILEAEFDAADRERRAALARAATAIAEAATARAEAVKAVKAGATAKAEAHAEGVKIGAENERKRIAAILDSEEAKDREPLARHLAFETDHSPEAARAALAKAQKETAGQTPLARAMAAIPPSNIGPGGGGVLARTANHGWDDVVAKVNAANGHR